jgi:putative secretion ATPase (PEP-CTERM system associated)
MYEAFYKLSGKPFQLNPDPSFYFASRGHKRAMSYLEYGLHQGEGFIVITGEIGAGKTTLVKNLFRRVDPNSFVAAQLVSTQLDADDTLRLIAAAFGLKHEEQSKAILLTRLEEYLLSVHRQGRRALLVVDEAQNLSPRAVEELRMLSNFQAGEKTLLQSFLLGQPEFRYTLQGEGMQQLRQRIIASYHLGPMDLTETRSYIEHRMKTVGWKGDPEFDEGCFSPVFTHTGGIPRRINTLCDRVLLFGYLEDRHRIDAQTIEAVIGDLNGEMPTLAANDVGSSKFGRKLGSGEDRMLEQLDRRVSKMERSIVNILKLSRELLNLAQEKQPEKRDRS